MAGQEKNINAAIYSEIGVNVVFYFEAMHIVYLCICFVPRALPSRPSGARLKKIQYLVGTGIFKKKTGYTVLDTLHWSNTHSAFV